MMDHFFSASEKVFFCNCNLNPFWLEFFVLVSHLFLVINSAVNFLIYFSVSKIFKKVFLIKLRLRVIPKKRQENSDVDERQSKEGSRMRFLDLENCAGPGIMVEAETMI